MRIGEFAERAGTSRRTVRYYEQQGLLPARRTANGYRDYDEGDLRLLREIRSLLEIGFNLDETRPFVECLRSGHESGAECPASVLVLARKLAEVDACIGQLLAVRARISRDLARRPVSSGLRSAGSEATRATREDDALMAPGPARAQRAQRHGARRPASSGLRREEA